LENPVSVEVRIPTVLRPHVENRSTVEANGATIGEVLNDLATQFPGLKGQLTGDDGSMHKFLNVYLNDDDVRYLQKLDTAVKAGDEVTVLPAVAGGAA
jgi:molybdopterin synthase sulfur carrier subunit